MQSYLDLFKEEDYPTFIEKYLETKTLKRLKDVTYFCGCDYTKLYHPKFLYTRYHHSIVVSRMTYHFTHDKKETIAALLHDVGTPSFSHCVDYVYGDYINQESSEQNIIKVIEKDEELKQMIKKDGFTLNDFSDFSMFPILENKTPKLCTDRLDGVFSTCYIGLGTHTLEQIKEVYQNLVILKNEEGRKEIGFRDTRIAEKFVEMVEVYAKELQKNKDKYVMKYISEIFLQARLKGLLTFEDLYHKKETELCEIFENSFSSWKYFKESTFLIRTDEEPKDNFYISFETKKRNTIPLVHVKNENRRINEVSSYAKERYEQLKTYKDSKYAYIENIKKLEDEEPKLILKNRQ